MRPIILKAGIVIGVLVFIVAPVGIYYMTRNSHPSIDPHQNTSGGVASGTVEYLGFARAINGGDLSATQAKLIQSGIEQYGSDGDITITTVDFNNAIISSRGTGLLADNIRINQTFELSLEATFYSDGTYEITINQGGLEVFSTGRVAEGIDY